MKRSVIHQFARFHDEIPAFHAGYIVLTFLAAALLNIGVFALLIFLHISLDLLKYHEVRGHSLGTSFLLSLREGITDIALLLLALVFAVYLHHSAGFIALSGILRVEGTLIRAAGMMIPKLGILSHEIPVFTNAHAHIHAMGPKGNFTGREMLFLSIAALSLLFLLAAPIVTSIDGMLFIFSRELLPWSI